MADALGRALELMARYDLEVKELLPADAEIFDAHLHLGRDIDGMVGDYDQLEALMAKAGVTHAFMFCLDEPDRHPAFRAANDRTLEFAARSGRRLIPFVRLDLNESPIEEAARCLDHGARGIKLHPRAQRFDSTDERLAPVFALAAERHVPILIHGGRGLPPIATGLAALVERNPEATLIIAHAGIADMAQLARAMAGRRNVFFDTSTWSPVDLLDFYRQIPPEQVLYASDYPYGAYTTSLFLALKTVQLAGYTPQQVRDMLSGNALRIAGGQDLPDPTKPVGGAATLEQPMQLARIHQYVSMCTPLLWTRQPDTLGMLGLAINTCAERDGHADAVDRIRELLEAARALWETWTELDTEAERLQAGRLTGRLVHLADIEAVTAAA
ncbi:MAG TPA: amidohydrolase family protein [Gaiellaceae bacterium]